MIEPVFLELDVRRKIYNCIVNSPGLHFREIQRRVGVATGSIDYHIHFLHKNGMIRAEKAGKYTRYYPLTKNWEQDEKDTLNLLRQEKIRHIVIHLLEKKQSSASIIADALMVPPSTLSWYLKQLTEKNVIVQQKKGRFRYYRLTDPKKMIQYLIIHRSSFLDKLVDRFIDTWEEK